MLNTRLGLRIEQRIDTARLKVKADGIDARPRIAALFDDQLLAGFRRQIR
jgi:hypothetical protein